MKKALKIIGGYVALGLCVCAFLSVISLAYNSAPEDRSAAIFEEGRRPRPGNLPVEACPYNDWTGVTAWKRGWAEGKLAGGAK